MPAVIVSAVRTAVGRAPRGALRFTRPDEMAAAVLRAALDRTPGLDPALVDDVKRYPEFLPWCRGASVVEAGPDTKEAGLDIGIAGLHKRFRTRNRSEPPQRIDIDLIEGPFRSLAGHWRFDDLPDGGCRIELRLEFEVVGLPLSMVFATIHGPTQTESFR